MAFLLAYLTSLGGWVTRPSKGSAIGVRVGIRPDDPPNVIPVGVMVFDGSVGDFCGYEVVVTAIDRTKTRSRAVVAQSTPTSNNHGEQ
jgi:hypothetical protein